MPYARGRFAPIRFHMPRCSAFVYTLKCCIFGLPGCALHTPYIFRTLVIRCHRCSFHNYRLFGVRYRSLALAEQTGTRGRDLNFEWASCCVAQHGFCFRNADSYGYNEEAFGDFVYTTNHHHHHALPLSHQSAEHPVRCESIRMETTILNCFWYNNNVVAVCYIRGMDARWTGNGLSGMVQSSALAKRTKYVIFIIEMAHILGHTRN